MKIFTIERLLSLSANPARYGYWFSHAVPQADG
jgi:hypothetical protein